MKKNTCAFTLVELVIVAVILAILATVGFISYEDYLVDTRDSKRLSQLAGLRDSMRLQITRGKLPLPDNSVEIRNNATPFLYQGYAGKEVLETISYSETTLDPYDDQPYTYLLSRNRKHFQLMGFLEKYNKDVISFQPQKAFANVDYSQRYPNVFGKKLGILLEQGTNTPLQEMREYASSGFIDLSDSTSNLFDAYVTDTYLISGKEKDLIGIIPYTTCKKVLEMGLSHGDGPYVLNISGENPVDVYCLMDTDYDIPKGWMLVARSVMDPLNNFNGSEFGWNVSRGSIFNLSEPYSFGSKIKNLQFKEMLVTTYTSGHELDQIVRMGGIDSNVIVNDTASMHASKFIEYVNVDDTSRWHEIANYGRIGSPDSLNGMTQPPRYFIGRGREIATGLNAEGYYFYISGNTFKGKPGMIFVR